MLRGRSSAEEFKIQIIGLREALRGLSVEALFLLSLFVILALVQLVFSGTTLEVASNGTIEPTLGWEQYTLPQTVAHGLLFPGFLR